MWDSNATLLCRVLELDVIAYLVNLVPAICIESLDDFSTVHRSIIHIGAYYAKKNTEVVWTWIRIPTSARKRIEFDGDVLKG
jgi:hypothetical protein